MHDAVVSKLIAASRGSPCDSMASCHVFEAVPYAVSSFNLFAVVSVTGMCGIKLQVPRSLKKSKQQRLYILCGIDGGDGVKICNIKRVNFKHIAQYLMKARYAGHI